MLNSTCDECPDLTHRFVIVRCSTSSIVIVVVSFVTQTKFREGC